MRTNIDIDDQVLGQFMKLSGARTKKGAVNDALRQALRKARARRALKKLEGIGWDGDLEAMRQGRQF